MVKKTVLIFILCVKMLAIDVFDKECVYCHKVLTVSLKDVYFKYLLRYSSEKSVKSVMFFYLKNPSSELSVMPKEYIRVFGIKDKAKLSDEDLKKAIDIYWDRYKVFEKIK